MKIVQINTFSNKSTGTIMMNIHKKLLVEGHKSYVVWGRGRKSQNEYEIFMGNQLDVCLHGIYTRVTDKTGFASKKNTKKLLKQLDEIKPDIIHLHNLHGYYINIEMLFDYLKKNKISVIWTLHDCWSFTGHCPHFELIGCEKWKKQCKNCPLKNVYPKSIRDNSEWNYTKKKELFTGLNMMIITPSNWLANLVKQSFLKKYEVTVVNNGIDTNVFKPTESNFKEKYNIVDKKMILGVASTWTKEKGLYDFYELSRVIDENYKIVLVGLNDKQLKQLPSNIIGIKRTESQKELAEIYTAADVYFNPTYADNFPTTNLEALACGTPVVTYNTGGSPESAQGPNVSILEKEEFYSRYQEICNHKFISQKIKSMDEMTEQYMDLYTEIH